MISLSTADSALKNVYLDVIKNELENDTDPFYSKIKKTSQDITGNEIKKLVTIGINGGIGAGSEVGSLPKSQENNYAALTTTLKNLYGQIEISDKAIRASQNETGAFLNLLNAEMENLIESSKFNLRRILYGDGDGVIAASTDEEDGERVYPVSAVNRFMPGMRVTGYDVFGDAIEYLTNVEVLDVDYKNETITLPVGCEYNEEETITGEIKFKLATQATTDIVGVHGILHPTKVTTLYGLSRLNNSFLTATTETLLSGETTFATVLQAIDNIKLNYNANIDIIVCDYIWRRNYQRALKNYAFNSDITVMEGGVRAITVNGIPVVANRFVEKREGYLLDSSTFNFHQLCDWTWLSNDKGQVIHQKEGYAAHTATLVKYCDLICDRPNRNGRLILSGG